MSEPQKLQINPAHIFNNLIIFSARLFSIRLKSIRNKGMCLVNIYMVE